MSKSTIIYAVFWGMLEGQLTWSIKDPKAKFMGSADATPMHPYFLIDISKFDHWNAETQSSQVMSATS